MNVLVIGYGCFKINWCLIIGGKLNNLTVLIDHCSSSNPNNDKTEEFKKQ